MFMSQAYIALFMCQIAVEIRMFSINKMFCKHYDAGSDKVMSTVTRRLLETKIGVRDNCWWRHNWNGERRQPRQGEAP